MESSGHDENDERLAGNLYMILGYTRLGSLVHGFGMLSFLLGRKKGTPDLQATNDREQSTRRFVLLSYVPQRSRQIGRRGHSSDGLFKTVHEQERVSRPAEV